LRDRLLEGDKATLEELIDAHQEVNVQLLRQLIRGAQKERDENQTPASSRKLFRLLRTLQEGGAAGNHDASADEDTDTSDVGQAD